MKELVLIAGLFLAVAAQARVQVATGSVEFKVENATYASSHLSSPGAGTLTVNYDKGTVKLFVESKQRPCPEGRLCALAMLPPLSVELPITSVSVDTCGIKHVVASKDMRPVDGALEKLTVSDATAKLTCATFVQVVSEATYESRYVNRSNGQEIVGLSHMVLALNNNSLAPAILVKLEQYSGFAPVPSQKTIYIDVTGRVISSVKEFRTSKVTTKNLAQLSNESLSNLKLVVSEVAAQAGELVDLNSGEPMCMDAPSSALSVVVDGEDVALRRIENCHTMSIQDYRAERLSQLLEGFQTLAK
jgi:hypothetical protein